VSRTVAHVYRNPEVPLAARFAGLEWASHLRWRVWFGDEESLSRATTRHIYRYRQNAGDRSVKENPGYLVKRVTVRDYSRVAYDRGNRITVLKRKKHRSNRTSDRMSSREALKLAGSGEDLTGYFGDHRARNSAKWDS
jgi:hypothetical protein